MPARITVRLTPRGGRDAIDGWEGDVLRVRVAAPPAESQANESLIRALAKALRVPPTSLSIISGAHARTKTIAISTLDNDDVRRLLGGG
jgi:uncharacterized protein (TIGR00251 family)